MKGIIFDFNGTLILDSPFHEEAWISVASQLRKEPLTEEEFRLAGHGRTNEDIITYLQGVKPDKQTLEDIAEKKESIYREKCLTNPEVFRLAPGVIPFLNSLQEKKVPITIATGSYKTNVDFYFQHLNLAKWFDMALVVHDDGTFPGKPAPDIFHLAAEKLHLNTQDCIVFEDSYMGIQSAYHAGVPTIIAVEKSLDPTKLNIPTKNIIFRNGFVNISMSHIDKIV